MTKKLVIIGFFVILLMALPLTTTAQEIVNVRDGVMHCPAGNRILQAWSMYADVDYAFDNFTVTDYEMNISADSMLDISILSRYDSNLYVASSWTEALNMQTESCSITEEDMPYGDTVFNMSRGISWLRNSTHEITAFRYQIILPPILLDIKNIGASDTDIVMNLSMAVETLGDRESVENVTLRSVTTSPYTYPPVDINQTTTPYTRYYLWSVEMMNQVLFATIVLSSAITALIVIIIMSRDNIGG